MAHNKIRAMDKIGAEHKKRVASRLLLVGLCLCLCLLIILAILFKQKSSGTTAESETDTISGTFAIPAGKPFKLEGELIEGHGLVAENDNWALYLEPSALSIIVKNKKTGAYMSSTVPPESVYEKDNAAWKGFYQSGVILEYIKSTNINYTRADFINMENSIDITVEDNGNGFWASVYFPDISISYAIHVWLEDNGVVAEIPQNSIVEKDETYTVGCFYIFPYMGSVFLGERPGYMLIPDGQGALIYLEDNEGRFSQPFSKPVYGLDAGIDETGAWEYSLVNESQQILAPIYGMVHTDTNIGFIGIIEEGDVSAKIEANPNGSLTLFDWITAKFIYRQVYTQPTGQTSGGILMRTDRANRFDARIRFAFVSGEDANYAGLAKEYRNYLTEKGAFANADALDFRVQADFFGADTKNWAIFKLGVNMTTFKQVAEILQTLNDDGVNNILSVYKGWQKGGVYGGLPTTGFSANGGLGGNSGLKKLFTEAEKLGTALYIEHDPIHINAETHRIEALSAMKRITRRTYTMYGGIFEQFAIISPDKGLKLSNKSVDSYVKNNVPGISITGVSNFLSSYYISGTTYDRADCAALFDSLMAYGSEALAAVLNKPIALYWQYAGALLNMPIGGSNYTYTDEEVPFLAIVLSGKIPYYAEYTNFQANQTRFFLQLIEQGAFPSFYLTWDDPFKLQNTNSSNVYSSRFDLYEPLITEYYEKLSGIAEKTKGSSILRHERDGSKVCVTYENGVQILLNYGEETTEWRGVTLEPMSYEVLDGENGGGAE